MNSPMPKSPPQTMDDNSGWIFDARNKKKETGAKEPAVPVSINAEDFYAVMQEEL